MAMVAPHVRAVHQAAAALPQYNGDRGSLEAAISYISDIQSGAGTSSKPTNSVFGDHELALALSAQEAGVLHIARETLNDDYRASRLVIEELEELEENARYDRLVAVAISEERPIPPRPPRSQRSVEPEPEPLLPEGDEPGDWSDRCSAFFRKERDFLLAIMLSTFTEAEPAPASSSSQPVDEHPPPAEVIERCTICSDNTDICYHAPCGHGFDILCLQEMFQKATHDESLFPPKCCQRIVPTEEVRSLLDPSLVSAFETKSIEFSTPDRVYCHKAKCSAFLGPANTNTKTPIKCIACAAKTCSSCKGSVHIFHRCSDRASLNKVAKQMHERAGWQRCPFCRHLVEKSDGCHHITCVCKAEFCYLCAKRWKRCKCPTFDVPPGT